MLDGRSSILLTTAFSLLLGACGGAGDVGAVAADVQASPTSPDSPPRPDARPDVEEPDLTTGPDAEAPLLGSCAGANPPLRCTADPQTFDGYGAAVVVTELEILPDPSCCADFNGDGQPDNALGQGMADIGKLAQINAELRESLVNGSQTIVLELEGLDDLTNDDRVALHFFSGQRVDSSPASELEVELDPATIEQGVAPLFTFENASVVDGYLVASHGEMELEASFNGVLLKPVVHDVSIRARIDGDNSVVTLRDGEVAGRLELRQLHLQINAIASGCDCLGLESGLVTDGMCGTPDVTACEAEQRDTCAALVEVCPVLEIVAANLADVDSNGDGTNDSISLGALFEAAPARITGVMR